MTQKPAALFLRCINIYQKYLRSAIPSGCRFAPSCSDYTREAIVKYGLLKGLCKGAKRLLCCHPFSGKSGYDPLL